MKAGSGATTPPPTAPGLAPTLAPGGGVEGQSGNPPGRLPQGSGTDIIPGPTTVLPPRPPASGSGEGAPQPIPRPGEPSDAPAVPALEPPARPSFPLPTTQVRPKPPGKPSPTPRPPRPRPDGDENPGEDGSSEPRTSPEERDKVVEEKLDYLDIPCSEKDSGIPNSFYTDAVKAAAVKAWEAGQSGNTLGMSVADAVGRANWHAESACHNNRSRDKTTCTTAEKSSRCQGPVAVCPASDGFASDEERRQYNDYISKANLAAIWGRGADPSGAVVGYLEKVPGNPGLNADARRAADAERAAHPERYEGLVVGHAPDKTWGSLAQSPNGFVPMTRHLNSSIAGQNNAYPVGYRASAFEPGQRLADGQCVLDYPPAI
ncbi:hypothetical protein IU433_26135 [Nocardia puris]|uniref:hypothetical protein n=1 Tax=Nocardia puris TaxID=208602 RepID=UPI001893F0B3|nr:hypothetical protein [Nocardia puris]MBF6215177.1 hypothetical protein [Nocardia puris]MBF6369687.1 hypothetical protein [Nocardia puris]MBF6462495.1 hypothetical protein [Nocardia puris]